MNPNGRYIDYGGPQYNKLIRNGYMLNVDGTQLIINPNFRSDKIKNPETGRFINKFAYPLKLKNGNWTPEIKFGNKFKELYNKYFYDTINDVFITTVLDPKTNNEIPLNSPLFSKRVRDAYIYDKTSNKLIKPSEKSNTAFGKAFATHELKIMNEHDPVIQMQKLNNRITVLLKRSLQKLNSVKFNIGFQIEFSRTASDGNEIKEPFHIVAKIQQILHESDIIKTVNFQNDDIKRKIDSFTVGGSGWAVRQILRHYINIYQNEPIRAKGYIQLPDWINNKKATINIKNNDDKCFIYCLGRRFDPKPETKNLERVSKHLRSVCEKIGFNKIGTPVTKKHFEKIEKEFNITINLYEHSLNSGIYPIRLNRRVVDETRHIDLLITNDGKENYHYVWIKDFDKLCFSQTKNPSKKHFCKNCIQCFSSKEVLERHKPDCMTLNNGQAVELPKEGSSISFNHIKKTVPVPFVIYADFESILPKYDNVLCSDSSSWTVKHQKHDICSYGYKVVCCYDDKYSQPYKSFRGINAMYKFLEAIFEEEKVIDKYMQQFRFSKMIMTRDNWINYISAKICYVCRDKFSEENKKVRDHCHITNKYRGAACNKCNLKLKVTSKIPIILHNFKGYDSHLLMQEIGKFKRDLNVIPNNMEKYLMLSVGTEKLCYDFKEKKNVMKLKHDLVFIDSFQFMNVGLEKLVDNLRDGENFKHLEKEFGNNSKLLTRKGIYPYSFMDCWEKFDIQTKDLKQEHFTNDLTGEEINDKDFLFYKIVCETLDIETLGEYHDLYLKTDVLLLADVFENFRKMCLDYYGLDPCHYVSAPGLAWDACLKMTNVNLELISDVDMYNFIEKGLRGGLSVITHRKTTANNKYMKDYDNNKPDLYIPYLDANNLYGWAMKQYLPYGGFKWKDPKEFVLNNIRNDSEIGHVLEVDLEYPKELHDQHNEYPYCPEHLKITADMLSDYSKAVADINGMKCGDSNKLAASLMKKEKYVIHERNLKQAVDAGLVLTKIHRVLEFKQKPWMATYIDFNTEKRKHAKNDFEKDFFKLMNNSVFGKTMENIRKRRNIKLITDCTMFKKYVAKPSFVTGVIFNEDLVAVEYVKEKLQLNKPIYLGFSILDLSKTVMYDFHYGFIKNKYGDNAKLLFTDTDSLCYEIRTDRFL